MKKIFVLILFLFSAAQSFSCPICGCGVGNFYMGLLPNFKSKFIGVRYQYMRYQTEIAGNADQFSNDFYQTVELWGGFSIRNKWQVLTFIPYQINTQKTDDGTKKTNGPGDITLLANYEVLNKMNMNNRNASVQQQLWIGGGIKLPTGKYHIDLNNPETEIGDVNSQQGTGSIDFLLNTSYNLRFNKFGINTTANYKINTANNEHYNFGNRFNAGSIGYYEIRLQNVVVAPNVGLFYQHSAPNHLNDQKVDETGGYVALAATGAELSFKKITIGANVQLPFSQNFAQGQTEAKLRGMMHLSFSF